MAFRTTLPKMAVKQIHRAVERLFDRVKARFLGPNWYSQRGEKAIAVGFRPELSLPGLYFAGVEEERAKPNTDTLNALMQIADGYLEAQREATKARVVKAVDVFLQEAATGKVKTDLPTVLGGELSEVWAQTTYNVKRIIDTESTHARNIGTLEGISRVNAYMGIEDPVVYFVVVNDELLCDECKRLHLMEDEHTPRLWLLSQIGHGYHRRGEPDPKVGGLHPHCRCTMSTLTPGWGFDVNGYPKYIGEGHDEYARQQGKQS